MSSARLRPGIEEPLLRLGETFGSDYRPRETSAMKCPTCPDSVLVMSDRSGIEIDYCPSCRGVWLDRGELDKIIERSSATVPADRPVETAAPAAVSREAYRSDDRSWKRDDDDDDDDRRRYSSDGYKPKKKKSLLGELFDF